MKPKANKSGIVVIGERFRVIIPTARKFHTFSDFKNSIEPINKLLNNSVDMAAFLASQFFIPSPDDAITLECTAVNLYDPNRILRTGVYASKDTSKPTHRNIQDAWYINDIGGLFDHDKQQLPVLPNVKTIVYCPFCPDIYSDSPSAWIEAPKPDDKTRVIHCSHCDASYFSKEPIFTDDDFIDQVAYSAASISEEPEPVEWIVQDVLGKRECFSIFGEAGSGKSYAVLQLAISVASETIKEWLGYSIVRHGTVLYILSDGSLRSLNNRTKQISSFLKVPKPARLFIFKDQGNFRSWKDQVDRFIRIKQPILIIIDSLAMSVNVGDENSASDQKEYSNLLKDWANIYQLNIAIVHHVTKAAMNASMHMNNFRGSNHWIGILAGMLEFRKNPNKELHNIYKMVKSRDGDPKVMTMRESRYSKEGGIATTEGVYDLVEREVSAGYIYVGEIIERGSKAGKTKRTPYLKDVLPPGETKPYRKILEDLQITYACGRSTAKTMLKEFQEEGLCLKQRDSKTGELFYMSTEKPIEI